MDNSDILSVLRLAKAASNPEDVRKILDLWESSVQTLSEEEVKIGPTEASSGEGASKMIRDYSDVAPQKGLEKLYEEFAKLLEQTRAAKSELEAMKAAVEGLIAKAEKEKEEKKEEKTEERSPGDFGEEYKDASKADPGAFARAVVREFLDMFKASEPEDFEEKEKVKEENHNQAAGREASKANDLHAPDGKFAIKHGRSRSQSGESEKEEEKKEREALKADIAELKSLIYKGLSAIQPQTPASEPAQGVPQLGRSMTPINIDALNSAPSSLEKIISKAEQDHESGLLSDQAWAEISTMFATRRHVEAGLAPRQVYEKQLQMASPIVRTYFTGVN